MVIIHIYGAIAIFLLFYDDQDTGSEECKIQMSKSQLIFTHLKTSKAILDIIFMLYRIGENIVEILYIYEDRDIFLLFYDEQDTVSE